MGFYGNITNTSKIQFTFDKTYQNRKSMEENMAADNIYIGRYVLVDYDLNFPGKDYARLYIKDGKFYFSPNFEEKTEALSSLKSYYLEDGSINPDKLGEGSASQSWRYYTLYDKEPVYVWDEERQIEVFYSANHVEGVDIPIFELIEAPEGEISSSNFYHENYLIDQAYYGTDAIGRGWDSTVWQKVYVENKEEYVMIAELNSVVPTFGVTVDPPTLLPLTPHFDADSSSLYYNLHVQPNWGFRVANYDELSDTDKENYGSDTQVRHRGMIYNTDIKTLVRSDVDYKGAIYYNKNGFDSDYRVEKNTSIDEISIKPTGQSGITYPNFHNGVSNPEKFSDIQELYINLPSLGNAVSDIWDILYGTGQQTTVEGMTKRNKTMAWDSYSGNRMVKETSDGYNYIPENSETVTGAINSIHDLMGMIIIEDDGSLEAEKALADHIYYRSDNNKFYIKDLTYTFEQNDKQKIEVVEDLRDFYDNIYYYKKKNNYYKANEYQTGVTYFTLSNIENANLSDEEYRPNTYYYRQDSKYILDSREEPADNINYYKVLGEFDLSAPSVNHTNVYFYPSDATYYDNMFGSRTVLDSSMTSERAGLFKYDVDKELYIPFNFDEDNSADDISVLYWCTEFGYEDRIEVGTNELVRTYKINTNNATKIKFIQFQANTYFYYDNDNGSYEYLQSLANAKNVNYYKFNNSDEAIEPVVGNINGVWVSFYKPNKYYYLENNNYIFAEEDLKLNDIAYFRFSNNSETQIHRTFYEPNKYYYYSDNSYVLDTELRITSGRVYYNIYDVYVLDGNGIYSQGEKWNINVEKPEGVILGNKKEAYQWKELKGFAQALNTIHGLIIKINQILKVDDTLTRDTSTVQGCINQLNDIIDKFETLVPNQLTLVNQYGKIVSSPASGDDWIDITTNDGEVKLSHKDPVTGTPNAVSNNEPNFGSTFEITDYHFDEKGHKYNVTTHTVKIPQGSLVDAKGTESTVITSLTFTDTTGELKSNKKNISSLKLDGFSQDQENSANTNIIVNSDTLGEALDKLQTRIQAEENNRATAITSAVEGLDMDESTSTEQFIKTISQTDGKISVTRANAGTLVLGEYSKASENGALSLEDQKTQFNITQSDSLSNAFGKLEYKVDKALSDKVDKSDKIVLSTTKFSYNIKEEEISTPATIQELFNYIAQLEQRIIALEDAVSSGEEENSTE